MWKSWVVLFVPAILSACGYVSEYEKAVYDYEPLYCYKSIGSVQCYETPRADDERRLVNYFGPAPSRYDKPEPAPEPEYSAPPSINYYVRDPEPVPAPAVVNAQGKQLPWLDKDMKDEDLAGDDEGVF